MPSLPREPLAIVLVIVTGVIMVIEVYLLFHVDIKVH